MAQQDWGWLPDQPERREPDPAQTLAPPVELPPQAPAAPGPDWSFLPDQPEPVKAATAEDYDVPKKWWEWGTDVAISIGGKGVIGVGEVAVGLLDIPTLGKTGQLMEEHLGWNPEQAKEILSSYQSVASQRAMQNVQQAEGVRGTLEAIADNPSVIAEFVGESLPLMLAGGVTGRAIGMIPKLGKLLAPVTRAAIGEGLVGAGIQAEGFRQQAKGGELTPTQSALAVTTGAATGIITRLSGGLAQKLGFGDIDAMLAGAARSSKAQVGLVKAFVGGMVSEGALEELPQSMQEQIQANIALDQPVWEGVSSAAVIGLIVGGVVGGPVGAVGRARGPRIPPAVAPAPEPTPGAPEAAPGAEEDVVALPPAWTPEPGEAAPAAAELVVEPAEELTPEESTAFDAELTKVRQDVAMAAEREAEPSKRDELQAAHEAKKAPPLPVAQLMERIREGGFTYRVPEGSFPTKGLSVSVAGASGVAHPVKKMAAKDLADFVELHMRALEGEGAHLGAWYNRRDEATGQGDDNVYLDISKVVGTAEEAQALAVAEDQIAYFNLETHEEVVIDYPTGYKHGPNWQGTSGAVSVAAGVPDSGVAGKAPQADKRQGDVAGGARGAAVEAGRDEAQKAVEAKKPKAKKKAKPKRPPTVKLDKVTPAERQQLTALLEADKKPPVTYGQTRKQWRAAIEKFLAGGRPTLGSNAAVELIRGQVKAEDKFTDDLGKARGVKEQKVRDDIPFRTLDVAHIVERAWNTVKSGFHAIEVSQRRREAGGVIPEDRDAITSWQSWLANNDAEDIAAIIENDRELSDAFLKGKLPEGMSFVEVLEALKAGQLAMGRTTQIPVTPALTLADEKYRVRGGVGEPSPVTTLSPPAIQTKWAVATMKRVGQKHSPAVIEARKQLLIETHAHHQNVLDALGITSSALAKKFRSWSNYGVEAMELQRSINEDTPPVSQWNGVQNMAWLSQSTVRPRDVEAMVERVDGTQNWHHPGSEKAAEASKHLSTYITRTLLALDSRIDYQDLSFDLDDNMKPMGRYIPEDTHITVRQHARDTVAHEIGHYLDNKWGREAGDVHGAFASDRSLLASVIEDRTSPERAQFMKRFSEFVIDIGVRADISSEYTQSRPEVFARFIAKFVEWTEQQAGVPGIVDASRYNDHFTRGDFLRFVELIQEKAFVDAKDGNPFGPAQSHGWKDVHPMRYAPGRFQNGGRLVVSSRSPFGQQAEETNEVLRTDLAAIQGPKAADYRKKAAGFLRSYDILTPEEASGTDDQVINAAIEAFKKNLRPLWYQFTPAVRNRARKWYEGAHRIAQDQAEKHGILLEQAAAIFAVLSPQQDWYVNAEEGIRVMDGFAWAKEKNPYFTDRFQERALKVLHGAAVASNAQNSRKGDEAATYLRQSDERAAAIIEQYGGRRWDSMPGHVKAIMIRVHDELTNTKDYPIILPEGDRMGSAGNFGWFSFGPIAKAISILEDSSAENINLQLGGIARMHNGKEVGAGGGHKIRSFYNNIVDPDDPNFVTIDTHAIAAAFYSALSQKAPEAGRTMGGIQAKAVGVRGLNPIIAEAYFQLATELGVLPRELQSVTWEAGRALFKPEQKRGDLTDLTRALWRDHQQGKIGLEELHAKINIAAQDENGVAFRPPSWIDLRPGPAAVKGGVVSGADVAAGGDVPAGRGALSRGATGVAGELASNRAGLVRGPGGSVALEERDVVTRAELEKIAMARGSSIETEAARAKKQGYEVPDIKPAPRPRQGIVEAPPAEAITQKQIENFPSLQKHPADIRPALAQIIHEADGFQKQRRDVQTWERTEALARGMELPLAALKPGTAANAEELSAYANAITWSLAEAQRLEAKGAQLTQAEVLKLSELHDQAIMLVQTYRGLKAETGRALNVLRTKRTLGNAMAANFIEQALAVPGFKGELTKIRDALGKAKGDPVKTLDALTDLSAHWFDYVQAYAYNNMLSGLKTHLRNFIGNSANLGANILVPLGAAPVDIIRAKIEGRGREVYLGESMTAVRAALQSSSKTGAAIARMMGQDDQLAAMAHMYTGWQSAAYAFTRGYRRADVDEALEGNFDTRRVELKADFLGFTNERVGDRLYDFHKMVLNWPSRALVAGDEFFRTMARNAEKAAATYAQARKEGLTDAGKIAARQAEILTATSGEAFKIRQQIEQMSDEFAARMVFQERPGPLVQAALKAKNHPAWGVRLAAMAVAPFVRTPGAILKQGIEWSPFGAFMTEAKRGTTETTKGETRQGIQAQGRIVLGSLMSVPLVMWAASGRLIGAPPDDRGERDEFHEMGKLSNSIRVPTPFGDMYVRYVLFQPFSVAAAAIANMVAPLVRKQERGETVDEGDLEAAILAAPFGALASLLDQSFLSGVDTWMSAMQDPERSIRRVTTSMATPYVPWSGAMRNLTGAVDGYYRRPQSIKQSIAGLNPFLSDTLRPIITRHGAPAKRPPAGGTVPEVFWRGFMVPMISRAATDKVVTELARLEIRKSAHPGRFSEGGEPFHGSDDQRAFISMAVGFERKVLVEKVIDGYGYDNLSDEMKIDRINDAYSLASRNVRREIKGMRSFGKPWELKNMMSRESYRHIEDPTLGAGTWPLER